MKLKLPQDIIVLHGERLSIVVGEIRWMFVWHCTQKNNSSFIKYLHVKDKILQLLGEKSTRISLDIWAYLK